MKPVQCVMLLLFLATSVAKAYECPNGCTCVNDMVSCLCESHDTVSLRLMLQLHIKKVLVDGCKQLFLPMAAMLHMDVDSVTFSNIDCVFVRPFALSGAERIGLLNITNVANFSVQSQGFSAFSNTENIILNNVHVSYAPKGSFGPIYHLEKFVIENSFFGEVDTFGINLVNISSLFISNTTFENLANESFALHDVGQVHFENVNFEKVMEDSITFQDVNKVEFLNCKFDKLKTRSIYGQNVNYFGIVNSTFTKVEDEALFNVDVVKKFVLHNNQFGQTENGALWPNVSSSANMIVKDNSFNCDANASWIWTEKENEIFLNSSKCTEDNKSLSSFANQFLISPTHDNMVQDDENVKAHERLESHASALRISSRLLLYVCYSTLLFPYLIRIK